MKREVLYDLIKKTRSPFISSSIVGMIFPYLACSSELCGSRMPFFAKTAARRPEQSMHLIVVPPMQYGIPRNFWAVAMISSGLQSWVSIDFSLPLSIKCLSFFSSSGVVMFWNGSETTFPEGERSGIFSGILSMLTSSISFLNCFSSWLIIVRADGAVWIFLEQDVINSWFTTTKRMKKFILVSNIFTIRNRLWREVNMRIIFFFLTEKRWIMKSKGKTFSCSPANYWTKKILILGK